jgi:hypothetical protein
MASNLIEFSERLVTLAAHPERKPGWDKIHLMMTVYGVTASQRSLYLNLHTKAAKALGVKANETHSFDVIQFTDQLLHDIIS